MKELLDKASIIISNKATKFSYYDKQMNKEDRETFYLKKAYILKTIYEKYDLFKRSIENFDFVDNYYLIVEKISDDKYLLEKDTRYIADMRLSFYLNDYTFFKNEFDNAKGFMPFNFKVGDATIIIDRVSVNIMFNQLNEDEMLDCMLEFKNNGDSDSDSFSSASFPNPSFNIVIYNYQKEWVVQNRKKINIQFRDIHYERYMSSFKKNDPEFFEKYKLLLD